MVRAYHLLVYGATGFTGRVLVEELRKQNEAGAKLKYLLCGRNEEKLKTCFPDYEIAVADAASEQGLIEVFKKADVVINVTGPYRFFGEQVMNACLAAKTHYVDICGEPAFLEKAEVVFYDKFVENNLVAIGSCGFDSIPVDFGVAFAGSLFPSTTLVNLVSAYHTVDKFSGINVTTYEAAVHGMANAAELSTLRKQLRSAKVKMVYPGGKRSMASPLDKLDDTYYRLPFPGADASVVRRTQAGLILEENASPIQAHVYVAVTAWYSVLFLALFAFVLKLLVTFPQGVQLLLAFPNIFGAFLFKSSGPTEEEMRETTFEVKLVAEGWNSSGETQGKPTRRVVARFAGNEPFYRFTSFAAIHSARCILEERKHVPSGVHTPWLALRKTTMMSRLRSEGVRIETVSDASI